MMNKNNNKMKLTPYEIFLSIAMMVLVVIYFITLNNNQKIVDSYEGQLKINHSIGWCQGFIRGMDITTLMFESGDGKFDTILMSGWYGQDSLFVETLKNH